MSRLLLLVLSGAALTPPVERTCNIPVFRYALERWQAAPYDVIVFHRGPLNDEARAALNVLRQAGANLEVDRVDVTEPLPPKRKALLDRTKLEAPCIVAVFPGSEIVAWSGPLTSEAAGRLADSPARREIARRLLEGESAVWLLLESGDRVRDDAAAGTLGAELKKLEQSLKVPAHAPDDPPLLSEVPVRVGFSVYRLARTDAAEASLVTMLLNSETGLEGPIVFPIFGRGRALWAMTAKGLTPTNIEEAGTFLIGACSCEAKELNPGVDLLFAADWEAGLAAAPAHTPLPTPLLKPRPPDPAPAAPSEASKAYLWVALVVAGLLVAVTGRRLLAAPKGMK
jgi:hypothetical protein